MIRRVEQAFRKGVATGHGFPAVRRPMGGTLSRLRPVFGSLALPASYNRAVNPTQHSTRRLSAWIVLVTFLANLFAMPLLAQAAGDPAAAQYLGEICSVHAEAADETGSSGSAGGAASGHCASCATHQANVAPGAAPATALLLVPGSPVLRAEEGQVSGARPVRHSAGPRAPPFAG